MTQEDVKGESQAPTTPSVENKEQGQVKDDSNVEKSQSETSASESVTTQPDIAENYKKAMQAEREKRKKLQERLNNLQQQNTQQSSDDPYDKAEAEENEKWARVSADASIARKLAEDPTFKDRADLVEQEMRTSGKTIDEADKEVLANFAQSLLKNSKPYEEKPQAPNQLTTSAVPESQPNKDWNMRDVIDGKSSTGNPFMDNAIRMYGQNPQSPQ